jgi:demethoxyubiquinone hydroxylase (CLK1/Coq7/Cat5 family)
MSSEPPFDHPPDHRRYEDPPLPPRQMPWYLTSGFKMGCGAVLLFLLTQCCVCGTVVSVENKMKEHIDARFNNLEKKLDDANKKPGDEKKDDVKKDK